MEAETDERHYSELCEKWGPSVPHARLSEIRMKTPEDLSAWAVSCRQRAVYACGRGNGDGFWEAKERWYSERAEYLQKMSQERDFSTPRNLSPTSKKRPVSAIRPMDPMPKRREVSSRVMPSDGGWPSGVQASYLGQTPSGLPTGEVKDTSSPPENLSPSPSQPEPDSLALIKESY